MGLRDLHRTNGSSNGARAVPASYRPKPWPPTVINNILEKCVMNLYRTYLRNIIKEAMDIAVP